MCGVQRNPVGKFLHCMGGFEGTHNQILNIA